MSLQFAPAGTSDALTLTGISKRSFDSDTEVGAPRKAGPPGYASVSFYTKMARMKNLYKLTEDGLIIGGAVLFKDKEKLNIGRIFLSPENFHKGYGSFMMREIEGLFPDVKEFTLDTPVWNVRTNSFYKKIGYEEIRHDAEFVYYSKQRYMSKTGGVQIKEERISAEEYIDFLKRTDLGSQYPKERFEERIRKLVKNVSISLIARNEAGLVVGALFGLTDYCYWLYVTDLGVDRDYERQGIATRLMKTAHEIAGGEKDIAVYLIANEEAVPFYEKIGMKKADDVMQYNHIEWTEWTV
ncbi:MAG: GNAT family N-acetyltransferase [Lachnospiraceae bacterium]|nr:GNAT family N-acetyltransferase [Lachnospiraceae bacterium]